MATDCSRPSACSLLALKLADRVERPRSTTNPLPQKPTLNPRKGSGDGGPNFPCSMLRFCSLVVGLPNSRHSGSYCPSSHGSFAYSGADVDGLRRLVPSKLLSPCPTRSKAQLVIRTVMCPLSSERTRHESIDRLVQSKSPKVCD